MVFRAGGLTGKVTRSGAAARLLPPDVLPGLAATLAQRLPRGAGSLGTVP